MHKSPQDILQQYWGYASFRGSQEKIITTVLEQKDVLALLPTGGGKSVCYQVPALLQEGICIVVSPLIALIEDQVNSLKEKGIKALALTGGISFEEVNNLLDNCVFGNYKFLYLSPERLQQDLVKERLLQMNVNLIAIDEAHCISQWGNDFRPAYQNCSVLRDIFPIVPVIALTATATKKVASDIVENLQFRDSLIIKDSFSRDNITYKVIWTEDKLYQLKQLCKDSNNSAIVYVRTRRLAEQISNYLNTNGFSTTFFHGGVPKKDKKTLLTNWLKNKTKIIVATNAFGMGIDKPDVRLVVHYQIPDSIENYYQEAGRAGRDQQESSAVLILNKEDENQVKQQFLSVLPDVKFLKLLYNKLNNYFQISYGEDTQETFQLNFNNFCNTYKLKGMLTYNALKVLDQHSVLTLTENYNKQATVQFTATKPTLNQYLSTHHKLVPIIQTLLRTYGGIFEFPIKINTALLSNKINIDENTILQALEKLQKDEIINYTAQNSDLEITFLVPREDDQTINSFSKKVKELQQVKVNNIEAMLQYINNDSICRNIQLLAYFGEKKKRCGKCDVCLSKGPSTNSSIIDLVSTEIITKLKSTNLSSRELIQLLPYKQEVVLETLQSLLEDQKIDINTQNKYTLQ
ncbi:MULTISPECIES: RecQ family ATP-dependent DNA helicase [unclassified Cellulophaga]|uniref:RecQ family ATP-dependent DNA helicase n=1 Tax=unclassified Cellulophaga TaxID=2634405 RepID=UPI0026E449F3|nr:MULTISPECIES: ATP-dependent DNA helicase RecQ [unclassified Cellulophaga]MDO6490899.1 ATP-dependent DNA helicase RecQ [Cellulophaga sp. 2_MG-2023]MDO6493907.1 ATP-dependent DNA helicase RecQ [Cellulophaga sp. 3_MG-2023]